MFVFLDNESEGLGIEGFGQVRSAAKLDLQCGLIC